MPAGRPKFKIDYEMVKKLANIQCTLKEIASVLGCSDRTLQNDEECMKNFYEGIEGGRASLRRIQWKHAEKSASMAMFLGKQYLGQRDNLEVTNTDEINKVKELLSKIEQGANNEQTN